MATQAAERLGDAQGTVAGDVGLAAPTRREVARTTASLVVLFVGMLLSEKIVGRLAISNFAQLISLMLLVSAFPRMLRLRDVAWMILGLACVMVAALSVYQSYGYEFQPQFTVFFAAAVLYVVIWYRATQAVDLTTTAENAVRKVIVPIGVYLAIQTAADFAAGLAWTDMGFDDKSHAAVASTVLAFLTLRLFHGPLKLPLSAIFMLLSLLTASRLPLLVVPFYAIAFLLEYRIERRRALDPWKVYICHTTVAVGVVAAAVIIRLNWNAFHVFTRIGPEATTAQSSTRSHLLLIWYGLQIKVDTVMNFLFGVTPGGYAGTVYGSDIDISELRGGGGIGALADGTAPMHSSHTSIFVEFPLPIFLLYMAFLGWLLVRLLRRRELTLALMLMGFVLATMFYSSHNELFFWATLVFLTVEATKPVATRASRTRPPLRASRRVRGRPERTVLAPA